MSKSILFISCFELSEVGSDIGLVKSFTFFIVHGNSYPIVTVDSLQLAITRILLLLLQNVGVFFNKNNNNNNN